MSSPVKLQLYVAQSTGWESGDLGVHPACDLDSLCDLGKALPLGPQCAFLQEGLGPGWLPGQILGPEAGEGRRPGGKVGL